jgi:hypothetical protein
VESGDIPNDAYGPTSQSACRQGRQVCRCPNQDMGKEMAARSPINALPTRRRRAYKAKHKQTLATSSELGYPSGSDKQMSVPRCGNDALWGVIARRKSVSVCDGQDISSSFKTESCRSCRGRRHSTWSNNGHQTHDDDSGTCTSQATTSFGEGSAANERSKQGRGRRKEKRKISASQLAVNGHRGLESMLLEK